MSNGLTCCNNIHVKNVTWLVALIELLFVVYVWIVDGLFFLGVTNSGSAYGGTLNFGVLSGEGGTLIGAAIWLLFILALMYGLKTNRAGFILAHMIASMVMVVLFIVQLVTGYLNGVTLLNVISPAVFAVVIVVLLAAEWRCYGYLKQGPAFEELPN